MKTTPCLRTIGFLVLLPWASAVRAQAVAAVPTPAPAPTAADGNPRGAAPAATRYYDAVPFQDALDQLMYDDALATLFPDLTKRRLSAHSAARRLNRTPRPITRQLMNA